MNDLTIQELRKNADYLAPDGSEIRLLPAMRGGGLCHCMLPPGRTSAAVRHKTVEEIWYFLIATMPPWPGPDEAMLVTNHWPKA